MLSINVIKKSADHIRSGLFGSIVISDGRFLYSKSKIEIFSQNRKNRNLDFITNLCIDFDWRGIHLY